MIIQPQNILPVTLAAIDVLAGVVYAVKSGDPVRLWYWLSAASITLSTVWMK